MTHFISMCALLWWPGAAPELSPPCAATQCNLSLRGEKGGWESWLKTFKNQGSWHLVPSLHGKCMGKKGKQWQILFSWAQKSLQTVTAAMRVRRLPLGRKAVTDTDRGLERGDASSLAKGRRVGCRLPPWPHADARAALWRRLSAEGLTLLHCGVGEDSWERLGRQGEETSYS